MVKDQVCFFTSLHSLYRSIHESPRHMTHVSSLKDVTVNTIDERKRESVGYRNVPCKDVIRGRHGCVVGLCTGKGAVKKRPFNLRILFRRVVSVHVIHVRT
mmetsp:Transcript_23727/g.35006  ORF Transcript_23727/g.35006 Transcript_23727/m.35006 type:complete len:101 (+) Transcript_23727:2165-2467(+)